MKVLKIEYAHCCRWTHGHLDAEPWSKYEIRQEIIALASQKGLIEDDTVDWVAITNYGRIVGNGETPEEAILAAQYFFMDQSREYAKAHAGQGTIPDATETLPSD